VQPNQTHFPSHLAAFLVMTCASILTALPARGVEAAPATAPATAPVSDAAPDDAPTTAASVEDVKDIKSVRELTEQTLVVLRAKCADCHGPQLAKPKKKFGYCLDLGRMAANPKYVVPFKPDASKLWTQINENEMPPEDAKCGPMTTQQKAIIKQWIMMGAPESPALAQLHGGGGGAAHETEDTSSGSGLPFFKRLIRLIGKFHPLIAHFPIALLVGAAVAELAWLHTRQHWLTGAVRFCTLFGAAGALVTASFGWADAVFHSSDVILTTHRWLGTAGAIWALPVVILSERGFYKRRLDPDRAGDPRPWFTIMLFVGVALIGIAAHFGGDLVYGTDYLTW
jgi:uncharacterized membrane protein